MDGLVDSPDSVDASSSTRVKRNGRRKPFLTKLNLNIRSSITMTSMTASTKPTRMRAQYLPLRLFILMAVQVPAADIRPVRRYVCVSGL